MENNHLENEEMINAMPDEGASQENAELEASVEAPEEVAEEVTAEATPTEEAPEIIEEPVASEPVEEQPVAEHIEEPVIDSAYTPSAEELSEIPAQETIIVHEVAKMQEEHIAAPEKKSKKKIPDNEFEFDGDTKTKITKESVIAFLRSVRFKRIWDKVSLGLLTAAFAIPVALLVYVILMFFL